MMCTVHQILGMGWVEHEARIIGKKNVYEGMHLRIILKWTLKK
jgi:hypothetical protein